MHWNKKKSVMAIFLALLALGIALVVGLSLLNPLERASKPQNWRVTVESVAPLSSEQPRILGDLVRLGQTAREQGESDLLSLPEEEAGAPSAEPEAIEPIKPTPEASRPLLPAFPPGTAALALIIDDVGLRPAQAREAMRLPPAVTLSFLPYAPELASLAQEARRAGHELMLHMPMEPLGPANPGPDALRVAMDEATMKEKIEKNINSFSDYAGLNNHMGSKMTSNRSKMAFFFKVLQEDGKTNLYFIDSRTIGHSFAAEEARQAGFRTASRDIFLDDQIEAAAIEAELAQAEKIARRRGYAVVIGHPHALTLQILASWLPQAMQRGVKLVPASAVVR